MIWRDLGQRFLGALQGEGGGNSQPGKIVVATDI
jgi:hypothetical protein